MSGERDRKKVTNRKTRARRVYACATCKWNVQRNKRAREEQIDRDGDRVDTERAEMDAKGKRQKYNGKQRGVVRLSKSNTDRNVYKTHSCLRTGREARRDE